MRKIILERDRGWADWIRNYKVIFAGQAIGTIGNGEKKEFEISSEEGDLYLKIDWCRSNKIQIPSGSGSILNFRCGSSLRGIKVLLFFIYILFMPYKYIWLREG